jgi:predicted nucleotidyltransferase
MKISGKQKNEIEKIAKKYQLELVLLFGSQVSGKVHAKSDIDIAVKLKQERNKLSLEEDLKLIRSLSGIFKSENIDLSVINHANPLLLKQINQNCQLLFGELRDFYKFRIYAFNRYVDYKKYFELESEFVKAQIAKL